MIVPSIDLIDGQAVQLISGEQKAIDAGDPMPLAQKFARCGEIAVIDLDAARGEGSNRDVIREICRVAPCRVGGGIRDVDRAIEWLDAGATKIILGSAATPELLRKLPRDRVIAALDARDGEVVVHGWRTKTGTTVTERMHALAPYVGGFLVTIVEREGRMTGIDFDLVELLLDHVGDAHLTIAGGVRNASEIAQLDGMEVDAQVGMALYTGALTLGESIGACLKSDRADGLFPTVVVDERGAALGLTYSSERSLSEAIETGAGVYWSRRRGLWRKGQTSGATQELLRVDLDCDRDALRFTVRQSGDGFCHEGTTTCWGDVRGLPRLEQTIASRMDDKAVGSYTKRLLRNDSLLQSKLREEVEELIDAEGRDDAVSEAADLLYFLLVRLQRDGIALVDLERELDQRALRVTRRGGDAKPATSAGPEGSTS